MDADGDRSCVSFGPVVVGGASEVEPAHRSGGLLDVGANHQSVRLSGLRGRHSVASVLVLVRAESPNPDWSRVYSTQEESWDYISGCAERFGVIDHVRLGHEVTAAEWGDVRQRWQIETSAGRLEAQFLISAIGPSTRSVPRIPGLDSIAAHAFTRRRGTTSTT